jgi:hypothetical protein
MPHIRNPILRPVHIDDLHPTQITVGMLEVKRKCDSWKGKSIKKIYKGLSKDSHMIPTVLGPGPVHYVTDHHHLARALHDAGIKKVLCTVEYDFSDLKPERFWFNLDNRGLMHPFDAHGRRRDYKDIPDKVSALVDDPYRGLAGEVRRAGGFAKDTTPFSEFLWADFFRPRIDREFIEKHPRQAIKKAFALAKSHEADYLPGWSGSVADDE